MSSCPAGKRAAGGSFSHPVRAIALHAAKLAVGVGIVAFLLRRHDFRAVGASILDADPGNLAIAWVFAFGGFAMLAWMHRFALRPLHMPLTTGAILKILFQIRFYSLFLPGGAGVVVKWHKFSKPGKQPGQALAVMVFSRVVHTFALLALALGAVALDKQFPWPGTVWGLTALLAATALATWLLLSEDAAARMLGGNRWAAPATLPIPAALRAKGKKLLTFTAAFRTLHAWEVALVLGAAFASGACHAVQHYFLARAVGLELSIWTVTWLRTVVVLCAVLPVSLSGLGLREASFAAILIHYGVPETDAIAYSLLFYAAFVVVQGIIGGFAELWDWLRYRPA